ncbi:MAG: hypothetical protein ACJ763_10970 [Bdellovibrionia bacterium]
MRRFQIMALLQAARAVRLGLRVDEAKSWGLNRAIFYAAARHGFRKKRAQYLSPGGEAEAEERKRIRPDQFYVLGGERGNLAASGPGGKLRFQMGGEVQTPYEFDRQIKARFGDQWNQAWKEARHIIEESDDRDLQNQQRFFNAVYKPKRDELAEKYTEMTSGTEKRSASRPATQPTKRPVRQTTGSGPIRLVTKSKTKRAA